MLKPTQEHWRFWYQRQIDVPKWARVLVGQGRVDVDMLIPAQKSPNARDPESTVLHNTLQLLISARKRGALVETLKKIAVEPGTVIRPERRAAYARRWLQRIERERGVGK